MHSQIPQAPRLIQLIYKLDILTDLDQRVVLDKPVDQQRVNFALERPHQNGLQAVLQNRVDIHALGCLEREPLPLHDLTEVGVVVLEQIVLDAVHELPRVTHQNVGVGLL